MPQLQALANDQNYLLVAISGSDNAYHLADVPARFLRHMFPTSPGSINLPATDQTSWQLPSNILHQIFHSRPQHQSNPTQQYITPWGLFTRMNMYDNTNQYTHTEQSFTIPFATRTASPELAIIRWLVHQRITHERQRVQRLLERTQPQQHPPTWVILQ